MTDEIRVYQAEMPARIKGFTTLKDGYYTIMINSIFDRKQQLKIYENELKHIKNGDFERKCSADLIEAYMHMDVERR